jgi:hypothetical protein
MDVEKALYKALKTTLEQFPDQVNHDYPQGPIHALAILLTGPKIDRTNRCDRTNDLCNLIERSRELNGENPDSEEYKSQIQVFRKSQIWYYVNYFHAYLDNKYVVIDEEGNPKSAAEEEANFISVRIFLTLKALEEGFSNKEIDEYAKKLQELTEGQNFTVSTLKVLKQV